MRFNILSAITLLILTFGVLASPVPVPNPVADPNPNPTVEERAIATPVTDVPVPETVKTACQKSCYQGYRNCIATGRTSPTCPILSLSTTHTFHSFLLVRSALTCRFRAEFLSVFTDFVSSVLCPAQFRGLCGELKQKGNFWSTSESLASGEKGRRCCWIVKLSCSLLRNTFLVRVLDMDLSRLVSRRGYVIHRKWKILVVRAILYPDRTACVTFAVPGCFRQCSLTAIARINYREST